MPPTADQSTLAAGVRDFLAGAYDARALRAHEAGAAPDFWPELVGMGLTGLVVPEAQGGLGQGLVEAALIAAECGRAGLVEPLVDTAFIAAPWLAADGHEVLAAVATGEARIAVAHAANPWIADLETATHVLAPDGGPEPLVSRSAFPANGLSAESIDPLRRLSRFETSRFDDARLLDLGALMTAAQLTGLAEAMLRQAADYAKVRQQFGQPIGAFQAVKHQLASIMTAIEFAKPVVWRAAQSLDEGSPHAALAVSHAKLAAGDAAVAAAETAIQTHGAMGYTYEVDLHYLMKRAWALAGAWGDRAFHLARVEAAVVGGTAPIGPEHTFI